MLIGVLFAVLMAVRVHLFKIDGRVLGGMQFGVLVQVLFGGGRCARIFAFRQEDAGGKAVWGAAADGAVGRSLWGGD